LAPGPGSHVGPADERPHRPGLDPDWEESWYFDFAAHDGSVGGFVRLALRPGDGTAWYWAYLAGPRQATVAVRDHELDLPRGRALEVRGPGLWAQVICETPLDHWSTGLEASAVALEDPAEGLRGERGQPVPLGLDLEWEATGLPGAEGTGYSQPATVHGEVLLGAERLVLDATGWWRHRWGPPPWRDDGWWWASAHLGEKGSVSLAAPGRGWAWPRTGGTGPSEVGRVELTRSGRVPASPGALVGGGLEVALAPAAWALVPLPRGRGLARSLCSWSVDETRGWGWCEWLQPPAS
jgi:hypothetical protein